MAEIQNFKSQIAGYVLKVNSIEVQASEITLIYGSSGSGKSSFLKGLCGVIPSQYDFEFRGVNWGHRSVGEKSFSIVFQSDNLFEHLSAFKNLRLVKPQSWSSLEFQKKLKPFDIEGLLNKKVKILSGGERQMISCARSLLQTDRNLVLWDEPWSSMDSDNREKYRKFLLEYVRFENLPCILISHNLDEEIEGLKPKYIYDFTQKAHFQPRDSIDISDGLTILKYIWN